MSKFNINGADIPKAEKNITIDIRHGIKRIDEYQWIRADNWQEIMRDPTKIPENIKKYLEAENEYQKIMMKDTKDIQKNLVEEMKNRIKQNDSSVPQKDREYQYQIKYEKNQEYPIYARTNMKNNKETILVDGPKESKKFDYFSIGAFQHSPDQNKIAWSLDTNGAEYYKLRIKNINDKNTQEKIIEDVGSFVWGKDSKTIVFTRVDENHRPSTVLVKREGEKEKIIYQEKDPRFFVVVSKSLDGETIIITTAMDSEYETLIINAENPDAEKPIIIEPRQEKHEYEVIVENGKLFILTNWNAENYRIMTTTIDKPNKENWTEWLGHRDSVMIKHMMVLEKYMVRLEKENALPRIVFSDLDGNNEQVLQFNEEAYELGVSAGFEYKTDSIQYTYTSPAQPRQVWEYNLETQKQKLLKEDEIPSGHNPDEYIVRRLHAKTEDNENVPITVLHRKDVKMNGEAPCLLYGYGSYGIGMNAGFSRNILSLVDRGFVYAIAHIRGGDEKGRKWYEQTRKKGKIKTFLDFIQCGKYLVEQKFTSEGKIIAMGGSAGGMLMGAVANMEKKLWGGIIAQVPFVDVLNTMLDDTLPLTPTEWSQWGNPIESKEEFKNIQSYSPYENIQTRQYPPIFALAGLTDPRVQYWEPAKWIAKLRDKTQNQSVIMLKTNMGTGHFGETGRFNALEEIANVYAFAIKAIGNV